MKTTLFSLGRKTKAVFAALIVAVSFGFMSCQYETDDNGYSLNELLLVYLNTDERIYGTWNGSYPGEAYTINGSTFSSNGSYAGDNVVISWTSNTSGYIYFKYTKAYEFTSDDKSGDSSWTSTTWPSAGYYRYSTSSPDVGKWYAVSFKNLDALKNTISISGASGAVSSTATLEEAKSTFTIANGYFAYYSDCTR